MGEDAANEDDSIAGADEAQAAPSGSETSDAADASATSDAASDRATEDASDEPSEDVEPDESETTSPEDIDVADQPSYETEETLEGPRPIDRARSAKDPPDDVEMPLTQHIEEMLSRLIIVFVIGGIATLIAFPFAGDIVTTMWYDIHPGDRSTCVPDPEAIGCTPPHIYGPLELLLTEIKLAALAGIVVALPVLVYQTYQFMRPGLYPNERRYYLASVPTSLILAVVGMAFAYFIILPLLFNVFLFYSEGSAEIAFALQETFDIILMLMAVLAIVFQIPLFIMLAIMMGVTTRRWLEERRLYFWVAFGGVAFIFSPDPTGMAPVLVGVTMIGLFEMTLLLLRWTGR